ncbi:MAG: hypothetical protein US86_C0002G0134 [Candidatus Daviesbacteria bacterium GW2011_GWA2_38_24]|uniref:DUF2130 domain-containing protein n=1 Tax=Candidatus Daviesbacteria bacterium GW2011_GWA2_38_24 TaxID=1618422 RepID=A0A0G0JJJ6_9BACT|nr:MAG: hypothetical protein US86_C0002G0134 [Candidatus Daviesbacteria bacterium GW2011_GWA2_38_24]KKQ79711.1 MAG: hypothetical protein UT01_C0030G0003 [Candidatus Daviesbacteria bacterium GW2011_GWA1_38_7]OGE22904.1 MAG: hypothetical protein A2688_04130 [Candidatus Daviesbacteria bacterium RIFCSPHIGHO2_01_FULL_38_8]
MSVSSITCPNCKNEISVDEALSHKIEENLKKELRQKMIAWQEEKEKALKKELLEKSDQESKLLKEELEEKKKQLNEAREFELQLRKEKTKLEDEKKAFELEKQRQLDEEREKIQKETANMMLEEHRLKDAEKDKQIEGMRKTIEELQLKANLTSQQLQGEVLELELEQLLCKEFPYDEILPVAKGIRGADVMQKVFDTNGKACGTIIWESKRTKAWSEEWVVKLKDDLRSSKADIAILITTILPQGVKNFVFRDGIYVTSFDCLIPVAQLIRSSLIQLFITKLINVGKNEKMEVIYNYLSGNEFRQRIEAIVEAFSSMREDLTQEKKVFTKLWSKREKEIDRVISNTIGMHGDLQGLMGASLPEIKALSVASLDLEIEEVKLK